MKILITGVAGFIGASLAEELLKTNDHKVMGLDNLNNYYDVGLKKDRLKLIKSHKNFVFKKCEISNFSKLSLIIYNFKPDIVIHLAAQAGIRATINMPESYLKSNIIGFFNLIEILKNIKIKKLIFASSSSVYGGCRDKEFYEYAKTETPLNLYAASKKTNEVLAHSYSHVYGIPMIGLRFFTVYGPWGRPDMLPLKLLHSIKHNKALTIYNNGNSLRDFTYIDDVINVIKKLMKIKNREKKFEIYNVGSSNPVKVNEFIKLVQQNMGIKLKIKKANSNKLDMIHTHANSDKLFNKIKYSPKTKLSDGISALIDWHNKYYS